MGVGGGGSRTYLLLLWVVVMGKGDSASFLLISLSRPDCCCCWWPCLVMDTLFYTGITQSLLIQKFLGLVGLNAAIIISPPNPPSSMTKQHQKVQSHSGVRGKTPGRQTLLQTCNSPSEGHWWHRCCSRTAGSQSQLLQHSSAAERLFAARQQSGQRARSVKRPVWPVIQHCIPRTWENGLITAVSSFGWDIIWPETPTHLRFQTRNEVIGSLGDNTWTLSLTFFYFNSVCFHDRYNDKRSKMQKHN